MDLKKLLLKDLSARLPYEVIVNIEYSKEHGSSYRLRVCSEGDLKLNTDLLGLFIQEEIYLKPYLHPMSSITKEEREEIEILIFGEWYNGGSCKVDHEGWIEILAEYDVCGIDPGFCSDYTDWLLEHHFDIRGLIEKGLAKEAPAGMYE